MADDEKRIALLIDADNAPAGKIDVILAEVARHGAANVRRAYGNWKSPHLKGWEATLHAYAIRPIQQFAYSSGKNASDMAMVIDAMDLLYARNLDGFAIVSSDADFTPLVMRLLHRGVKVYGFGEQKTPRAVRQRLLQVHLSGGSGAAQQQRRGYRGRRQADAPPRTCAATPPGAAAAQRGGRPSGRRRLGAPGRRSGSQIGNQASFDSRNYGYRKLSDLIEATELFEVKRQGQVVEIRERVEAAQPARTRRKPASRQKAT